MITIVGVGALGSHLALFLRNEQVGLKLIDFDRIESKNTQAQFHTRMSMGHNKAQAMTRALHGMFGVNAEPVPSKLTKDNVEVLLSKSEIILDCTDNIEARSLIRSYYLNHGTPTLHGALSADGTFARIVWSECFVADAEGEAGEATCVDGEHLPFFAAAAAYMAIEAQRFLRTGKRQNFQLSPSGIMRT
jgi:molybdopterin/thiamine biosynthesis adenylyltransferase